MKKATKVIKIIAWIAVIVFLVIILVNLGGLRLKYYEFRADRVVINLLATESKATEHTIVLEKSAELDKFKSIVKKYWISPIHGENLSTSVLDENAIQMDISFWSGGQLLGSCMIVNDKIQIKDSVYVAHWAKDDSSILTDLLSLFNIG